MAVLRGKPGRFLAIALFALLVRAWGLPGDAHFAGDEGRDVLAALGVLAGHTPWPLLGPTSSVNETLRMGALHPWMVIAGLAVSHGQIAALVWLAVLLGMLGVAAIGRLGGGRAALVAASSPLLITHSRWLWNPNALPLCAALALLGWRGALRNRRGAAILIGVALGAAFQLHYSAAPLLVVTLGDLARRRRWRDCLTAGAIWLVCAAPQLLAVIEAFPAMKVVSTAGWSPLYPLAAALWWGVDFAPIALGILVIGGFARRSRPAPPDADISTASLLLWVGVHFGALLLLRLPIPSHYVLALTPGICLLLVRAIDRIESALPERRLADILLGGLVLTNLIAALPIYRPVGPRLADMQAAVAAVSRVAPAPRTVRFWSTPLTYDGGYCALLALPEWRRDGEIRPNPIPNAPTVVVIREGEDPPTDGRLAIYRFGAVRLGVYAAPGPVLPRSPVTPRCAP